MTKSIDTSTDPHMEKFKNPRSPQFEVDPSFTDRWSPRKFLNKPLNQEQIKSLFEAARWAPSCFNEQPWLFLFATQKKDHAQFLSLLVPANQQWAADAPLLIFLAAKKTFEKNQKPNRHAGFDCGAAWMSLALQARKLGLHAHAMAGFDVEKSYDVLNISKNEYDLFAAIAVGYRNIQLHPNTDENTEEPNQRKPTNQVYCEGTYSPKPSE